METYIQKSKLFSAYFKKFNLFLFFSFLIIGIEACQTKIVEHEFSVSDAIRAAQSRKLLEQNDDGSTLEFNGDPNFSRYISSYIEDQNKTINSDQLTNSLLNISRRHGDDPVFLLAVIKTESKFNQNAIGSVGEVGLMQIRPETAEWICQRNNLAWRGATALKDPSYNVLLGSYYFQYLKKALKDHQANRYITAYNMGLTALKHRSQEKLKENDYFARVAANYAQIYSELKKIKYKYSSFAKL